ncbi:DsrE family protein [Bacillus sp. B15-48]|uniref:DsrE family protein n=1 Tax=Bacillus sp. B15-48 TaxID=1548601 RepID=UPI00193ECAA2|nr:DsrE family protein [Bacillus sp. B15-48]MBM4763657.1 multidrug transporter [Bacillus sp. B15-48]
MAKILIHLTHGPSAPTQADRAFLIAKTAVEEGHQVSMFLAGEAVELIKDENLDKTLGVGVTAVPLKNSVDAIISGGGRIVLSKVSCGARNVGDGDLVNKDVELGMPNELVKMTVEHDKVITYG